MEGVGDRLSRQGAGQMLIKLSHPGSAFLLKEYGMAKSKVYVTRSLCNCRQNINYLCVLLGAVWHGWLPGNLARATLCWKVTSSSHRTWLDICPGGRCLFLMEPYKYLVSFLCSDGNLQRRILWRCPCLTGAGMGLVKTACRKVFKGGDRESCLKHSTEGAQEGPLSTYCGQRRLTHVLSPWIGGLCDTPGSASPELCSHFLFLNFHFLRWKVQTIGTSWLNRGVSPCNDPDAARGSENSPSASGDWSFRPSLSVLSRIPQEQRGTERPGLLPGSTLYGISSLLLCTKAWGQRQCSARWAVLSSSSMSGERYPLLIKTKNWEGAGGFSSDEILFSGPFWCSEWKKENFSRSMACLECNMSYSLAETFCSWRDCWGYLPFSVLKVLLWGNHSVPLTWVPGTVKTLGKLPASWRPFEPHFAWAPST